MCKKSELSSFFKRIWNFIVKAWHFIIKIFSFIKSTWWLWLMILFSIGVFYFRESITSLDSITPQNIIFILWLLLLFWPLFSEMEFLGVKIKKEVEKETKPLNDKIFNLQSEMINVQNNTTNVYNGGLMDISVLQFLLDKIKDLPSNEKDDKTTNNESSNLLFEVKYSLQKILRELRKKYNIQQHSFIGITRSLENYNLIDSLTSDLIVETIKIISRGVHGEIISDDYIEFVKQSYPKIEYQLNKVLNYKNDNPCPKCKSELYNEGYPCPNCGYKEDYDW